jgi:hypothetical protein
VVVVAGTVVTGGAVVLVVVMAAVVAEVVADAGDVVGTDPAAAHPARSGKATRIGTRLRITATSVPAAAA